jgi:hypothetical protein
MEYLGAWGTPIHEKNLKSKISCQTLFKGGGKQESFLICNNANCCHITLNVLLLFRLALVSCGGGVMTVYRSCTNPAPQGGGANCSGLARMDQACNVNPCPLESGQCGVFYLLFLLLP